MEFDEYEGIQLPLFICNYSSHLENYYRLVKDIGLRDEFEIIGSDDSLLPSQKEQWIILSEFVSLAKKSGHEFFLMCGDSHEFSPDYSKDKLIKNILASAADGIKMLLGGLSIFNNAVILDSDRCWIDFFKNSQFIVIYSELFPSILSEPFTDEDQFFEKLTEVTGNKAVIFPFISTYTQSNFYESSQLKSHCIHQTNSYKRIEQLYNINSKYKYLRSKNYSANFYSNTVKLK